MQIAVKSEVDDELLEESLEWRRWRAAGPRIWVHLRFTLSRYNGKGFLCKQY